MSKFFLCNSDPEAAISDDVARVLEFNAEDFCANQQEQEEMPTFLAETVNTAIALSDALKEYVGVSADYDIYPVADKEGRGFDIRVTELRRADGDSQDLELPPSYSMLLAALVGYAGMEVLCMVSVPALTEELNKVRVFAPRSDVSTKTQLLEVAYDGSGDSETFDTTRALYLLSFDATGERWKITVVGSYDIESQEFRTMDDVNTAIVVDKETLEYAKSDKWYKKSDVQS